MAGDLILYRFSKWKVEHRFFSHFLGLHAFDKLPTGRRLRDMVDNMVLCVDGYDEDERETHVIPEVRRSCGPFHSTRLYELPCGRVTFAEMPHLSHSIWRVTPSG